ncbi:IS1 family transposase [Crocosphaera chwakensis]|uniref:Iso-IS1 ORF2 n=1 Tax=Crocosphaera chwakensis CCY0110 TaxID=391612 RepID=A3IXU4_9CHRO|nr:IS1 family transposase [Crocosphaera chwakensis]EAZ88702.1 iso-IS1 ORF2 [Crocosphaera chwakensis CCY0110]
MKVILQKAEVDKMKIFVAKKEHERWLWHAIDHQTGTILAYVLGQRTDQMFLKLKTMLKPFGISEFYTDNWGSYKRHLSDEQRTVSKYKMQKIERKHLTLRTRIKRLQRKTICFSKISPMHDLVIGLYINKYEFHRNII